MEELKKTEEKQPESFKEVFIVFQMPEKYGLNSNGEKRIHVRMDKDCEPGKVFLEMMFGNRALREGIMTAVPAYLASLKGSEAEREIAIINGAQLAIRNKKNNKRLVQWQTITKQ